MSQASDSDTVRLSDHEEKSVDAIAIFHREHYHSATPLQRALDAATERLGRPVMVIAVFLAVVAWIVTAEVGGRGGVAQPAFTWLELVATVTSLLVSILILATQRREDQLGDRRAKLTLELAILTDRKNAKIIALLEELRRDTPGLANRIDLESDDMAKPTDPTAVLAAIEERSGPD